MIIIGIDPGTNRIGHAVIEKNNKKVRPVDYGCWELKIRERPYRLLNISKNVHKLIKDYKPDYLAIESIFFFHNAKTVMQVSEARGVILLAAAKHKIAVIELAPLEVKQKLTGYGRSEKVDVQKTVKKLLKLKTVPQPDDTADALAVALAGILKLENGAHKKA